MESRTYFVAPESPTTLHDVAVGVFSSLGIQEWEERFSSNYPPDEHYFAGYASNATVTVFDCDDDAMPDFPMRVWIQNPSLPSAPGMVETDPPTVAKLMASGGLRVFVPRGDWWRGEWDNAGDVYAR